MKKNSINEQFFDAIDTEAKAYFLGLLFADGCNDVSRHKIILNLQEKDKSILNKFKEALGFSGNLQYLNRQNEKDGKKRSNQFRLAITNKNISSTLASLGCVPRKSLILKFPSEKVVPKHLQHHFIRGYFDGDGCISIPTSTPWKVNVNFAGSKKFLNILRLIFSTDLMLSKVKLTRIGKIYVLRYGGRLSVKKIQKYLYNKSTIYLDRKYNKFYEIKYKIKGFETKG